MPLSAISRRKNRPGRAKYVDRDNTLPLALSKLQSLKKITLSRLDWGVMPLGHLNSFSQVLELPTLTSLVMTDCYFTAMDD
jgi:hypothetical protein